MDNSIGFTIGALHRGAHKYFEKYMGALGLHRGMVHVLLELDQIKTASQQELCREIMVDKANMTRILNKLEEEGLICRKTPTRDRRSKLISLTEEGKNILIPVKNIAERWLDIITTGMSEDELSCYLTLLLKSRKNMEEYFRALSNG